MASAWGPGRLKQKDPLEALERVKAAAKNRARSQVDDLSEPIVQIRHGRGVGVYVTRWITTSGGQVLEHEETTSGIGGLARLLRHTIRRDDAEQIVQHVRATAGFTGGARGLRTTQQVLRGPDDRRRQEAANGMEPAWKLDREDFPPET